MNNYIWIYRSNRAESAKLKATEKTLARATNIPRTSVGSKPICAPQLPNFHNSIYEVMPLSHQSLQVITPPRRTPPIPGTPLPFPQLRVQPLPVQMSVQTPVPNPAYICPQVPVPVPVPYIMPVKVPIYYYANLNEFSNMSNRELINTSTSSPSPTNTCTLSTKKSGIMKNTSITGKREKNNINSNKSAQMYLGSPIIMPTQYYLKYW